MTPAPADSGRHEAVTLSLKEWPYARVEVARPPGRAVAREIRAALLTALRRAEPHVAIVTLHVSGLPSPGLLLDQAEWFGENRDALSTWCRGLAIVTSSAAMRGIPNAMLRLVSTPMPMRAFSLDEAARTWGERMLNESVH